MKRTPYFANAARGALLWDVARSWEGTPFRPDCTVKGPGGGVNCTNLARAICVECGIADAARLELPQASMKHHEHHTDSVIMAYLSSPIFKKRVRRFDIEDNPEILPGDLLGVKTKLTEHHLIFAIGRGQALHCDRTKGVYMVSLQMVRPYLKTLYRIME